MTESEKSEESRKRFYERLEAWRLGDDSVWGAKPKPTPVLTLPVSDKIAEAVAANPESVRVSARGADGIAVVEGPRRNSTNVVVRVDLVREVDAEGRPIYDARGVEHEYDPLARGLSR